jgi:hypothetical protein
MSVEFGKIKGTRISAASRAALPSMALLAMMAPVAIIMPLAILTPAIAQAPRDGRPAAPRETIIGGQPPPNFQQCIEVEIGGERGFGCLNQQLKREVDRVNSSLNLPPLDARSSDVRVGNVNEAAVRQQYGSNYGRSVFPSRPPPPVFVVPRH